ncbi:MAG: ABC transporter ATP-binding protein [Myxococcota bacterium]
MSESQTSTSSRVIASGAPLLEVKNLQKFFPIRKGFFARTVGHVKAVNNVSFNIHKGECVGLVGESGCGKTTVGRTILKLIEPTGGEALFEGHDIFKMDRDRLRSTRPNLQIIFQDPYSSLNPRMTVLDIVGDAMEVHGIATGDDKKRRVRDVLARCGLNPDYATRYPHEFSGGQRQRVGIARALALNPKLIICDEAVSALDVSIRAQIINLLADLQKELGLSYLFISHDLSVIKHMSDRIAVMYLGEIVEEADCEPLYQQPLHPYTSALLSAIPVAKPGRASHRVVLQGDVPNPSKPPPGCYFHLRCPEVMDKCKEKHPALVEVTPGRRVACFKHHDQVADVQTSAFSV